MSNDLNLESVTVSSSPQERFEEYLQSRGMRNTEQRRVLLDCVFAEHEHFDADALIEKLPRRGEKGYVSRPTVYRTLTEFVDAGLLRKLELDGRAVYEHDYGYPQHDHLYCEKCERLLEFQNNDVVEKLKEIAAEYRFQIKRHRLVIHGICEDCRKQRRRVKRKVDLI